MSCSACYDLTALYLISFKMTEETVADTKPDKETNQQEAKGKKNEDDKEDSSVAKEQKEQSREGESDVMGPLQLAVTWYKIRHAGEQATHWDIQNKENAFICLDEVALFWMSQWTACSPAWRILCHVKQLILGKCEEGGAKMISPFVCILTFS